MTAPATLSQAQVEAIVVLAVSVAIARNVLATHCPNLMDAPAPSLGLEPQPLVLSLDDALTGYERAGVDTALRAIYGHLVPGAWR